MTLRGNGPARTATDGSGFTGTRYVARMWTTGITQANPSQTPPYPNDGSQLVDCNVWITPSPDARYGVQGYFMGQFTTYLVETSGPTAGTEHPTGIKFRALIAVTDQTGTIGPTIGYMMLDENFDPDGSTPPFPMPGGNGHYLPLNNGNAGMIDGPYPLNNCPGS